MKQGWPIDHLLHTPSTRSLDGRNAARPRPNVRTHLFLLALYKSGLCRETFARRHIDVQVSPFRRGISKISRDLIKEPCSRALSLVHARLVHRGPEVGNLGEAGMLFVEEFIGKIRF